MPALRWLFGQPYLLLSLTALFWGGNAVAGKIAVGHISPFLLTSLRWLSAMAIILPLALPQLRRDWPVIRRHLPFLVLLGTMGFTIFNNLMYWSLTYTSAINVAIIQASMPLMVFVLNFTLFRIATTWLQAFGFLLTLAGVLLTAANGSLGVLLSLDFNRGDLIMLIAIMIYGAYSVLLKNKPKMHWMSFITVLGSSAFTVSLLFTGFEAASGRLNWPDTTGWIVIAYTAIFASLLSQVFWIRGLELIGSNRGGIFINIVPIAGAGLAILILGEQFRTYHAIALVLVVGGVWIAQHRGLTRRNAAPPAGS